MLKGRVLSVFYSAEQVYRDALAAQQVLRPRRTQMPLAGLVQYTCSPTIDATLSCTSLSIPLCLEIQSTPLFRRNLTTYSRDTL